MDSVKDFEFPSTNRIIFGHNSIDRIGEILAEYKIDKALICTDKGIVQAGIVDRIVKKVSFPYVIYDGVQENPAVENVETSLKIYREHRCNVLLGIGGGSSIDTAKAVGILVTNKGSIIDYEQRIKVENSIPFLAAVPTTYGTGSEVTSFTVITDAPRKYKMVIASRMILPKVAILDPTIFLSLPSHIGAATGMDALTHAIEAYTSMIANPITDAFVLHSIRLISKNLRQAISSNQNLNATTKMVIASTLAGMAFEHTALGDVHAMSQPMGAYHRLPHGVANAILLANVMEFNLMSCPEKFADVARAMGEETDRLTLTEAAKKSVEAVRQLSRDVGIPERLRDLGVTRESIPEMAKDAFKSVNISVNPRKTTLEDIIKLYEKTF